MPNPTLEKELQHAFASFVEYTSPARLSRGLRNMLLLFLEYENGMLPDGLKDLPMDMSHLFELLDVMEVVRTERERTERERSA